MSNDKPSLYDIYMTDEKSLPPIVPPIPIPLKKKYLTRSAAGFQSKSGNSTPKKKTIWKHLAENSKKRGR